MELGSIMMPKDTTLSWLKALTLVKLKSGSHTPSQHGWPGLQALVLEQGLYTSREAERGCVKAPRFPVAGGSPMDAVF